MGDQGCCCIDEFDKMSSGEHQALLEAMEQQSISVAKARVTPAQTPRSLPCVCPHPRFRPQPRTQVWGLHPLRPHPRRSRRRVSCARSLHAPPCSRPPTPWEVTTTTARRSQRTSSCLPTSSRASTSSLCCSTGQTRRWTGALLQMDRDEKSCVPAPPAPPLAPPQAPGPARHGAARRHGDARYRRAARGRCSLRLGRLGGVQGLEIGGSRRRANLCPAA